ncbi:MAG TPA: peptidylprolyl isomerase [Planctomycetes bacterium]|nr:peptidylprolyl isomerase [Planctomycetota bacterium]
MAQAETGDIVKINFTGKLEDGSIFADTADSEPLEFKLGEGSIIPGIENAVEGMNVGESKSVTISPDQAYGQRQDKLVAGIDRDKFPKDVEPKVGQKFEIPQPQGQSMVVRVVDVSEQTVTVDGNHPLAGRDLTFELQLLDIASKS